MKRDLVNFVAKGWGFEKWIVNNEKYCGKLLYFVKGRRCSLHYHRIKDECFFIQSGRLVVAWTDWPPTCKEPTEDDFTKVEDVLNYVELGPGDIFDVPPYRIHQMTAMEDTELFEFSTQHFDEDSYRVIKGD